MAKAHLFKRRGTGTDTPHPDPESGPDLEPEHGPGKGPQESPEEGPEESSAEHEGPSDPATTARPTVLHRVRDSTPVTLFLAAHPRQALATAIALALAALVSGRPAREAGIVFATVVVGQAILGWHNDLVDRERDAIHETSRKPLAQGRLDPGTAWYALVVALLLVIPLSISVGVTAGMFYLVSLVMGIVGNVALRRGRLSPLPWMAAFALYPAYLSYGGFGGNADGDPPQVAMVVAAALLGLGVHFLRSIWGLVEDDREGWTYLPLVLGRRLGATRLLVVSTAYTAAVATLLVLLGSTVGLRQ